MGIFKRIVATFLIWNLLVISSFSQDKPIILQQGQSAPYTGYLFSEPQFDNILKLKADYSIDKKLWDTKEKIYIEAIKEAEKKIKGHWWESGKFNFILGILVCVASAYVIKQIK